MNVVQIRVEGDEKSEYYSTLCNDEWAKYGVTPTPFWGTTPNTIPEGPLRFAKTKFSGNPFTLFEKAIWYSHFRVWQSITGPTYVIEHDTYPIRPLPEFEGDWGLFSLFPANEQAWLGTKSCLSPGSGYYINRTSASILMDMAQIAELTENVDGHIEQIVKRGTSLNKAQLDEKYLRSASCFQIVNYDIGTTARHNDD